MVTKILPEKYQLIVRVTWKKNVKLVLGMNAVAFIILILFAVGPVAGYAPKLSQGITFTISLFPIMIAIIGIIAIMTVHELVHGFFIGHFTGSKVKYGFHGLAASAGSPDFYFQKKEYIQVALSPFIIINLVLAAILPFLHSTAFSVIYWILAFHFAGCVGDLYLVLQLRKYKDSTFIRDSGPEMEIFTLME